MCPCFQYPFQKYLIVLVLKGFSVSKVWLWLHWRTDRGLQVLPKLCSSFRKHVLKYDNTHAGNASTTKNELSVISVLWIEMKCNLYLIFQFLVGHVSVKWGFRLFVWGRHALRCILFFLILHLTHLPICCCFLFFFPDLSDVCGTLAALASARLCRTALSGSPSFSRVRRCWRVRRGAVLTWTWAIIPAWAEACSRRVCTNA